MPSSRQPPAAWLAESPGPGGCAAQTPQRLPAGGAPAPSSARMASASTCPSDSRAKDRSSPARSARFVQRSQVRPLPGSGRSSCPDSTAAAKSAATSLLITTPLRAPSLPACERRKPRAGVMGRCREKPAPFGIKSFGPNGAGSSPRFPLPLLGSLRGTLLRAGAAGGERSVRRFQVRPDEPVVLLQLTGLLDEQVLGDRVEFLGRVDGPAVCLDDAGVHHVEGTEVLLGA